ncbi:MAG: DUF2911 domain-containing protein [Bacteroidota bacterium]
MKYAAFVFFCLPLLLWAQEEYPFPSLSPKTHLSYQIGDTEIEIEYERPAARGRTIYGELVPWNKVWRTGAGDCTKISFSRDVRLNNQAVPKGTYSLFSIPSPDQWVIILNADTSLYGSPDYDSNQDIVRFVVRTQQSDRFYESLTFDLDFVPNHGRIYISWTDVQVSFDLFTDTDQTVQHMITTDLLTKESKVADHYLGAAEYLLYQQQDYAQALKLVEHAFSLDPKSAWGSRLNILLLMRLKYHQRALAAVDAAVARSQQSSFPNAKEKQWELNYWESFRKKIQAAQAESNN